MSNVVWAAHGMNRLHVATQTVWVRTGDGFSKCVDTEDGEEDVEVFRLEGESTWRWRVWRNTDENDPRGTASSESAAMTAGLRAAGWKGRG